MTPRRHWLLAAALALLTGLVTLWLLESDFLQDFGSAADTARRLARHFGPAASFAGLYAEESGVPLPVAGDVLVLYLGHRFDAGWLQLAAVWLGLIATVTLGASNLYFISRRWGRRLVAGPLGPFIHLTPDRLARAERWFTRWGPLAVIFGRHIFGFRVPVTVAAGLFGLPYRVFAPSVAISTAPWAAAWLYLGVRYGDRIGRFIHVHRWTYFLVPVAIAAFVAQALIRAWLAQRRHKQRRAEL